MAREPAGEKQKEQYPPARTGQPIHTLIGMAATQPPSSHPPTHVEHQGQSADQRSPEPSGPLHGDHIEDQGADESAAGPGQEHAGDGQPEAVRESRQEATQSQDPGSCRHHAVGRAPVHPDGRGHHEQACQARPRGADGTRPR